VFVDSSALVAILTSETDAETLLSRLEGAAVRVTSPWVVHETVLGICRKTSHSVEEATALTVEFLARSGVILRDIPADLHMVTLPTHARYGKGMGHPAQLNMGDCFSYAMAKTLGQPLLYKGEDFAQTDLA